MPKFRKKPVVIEAVHWRGKNFEEVRDFVGNKASFNPDVDPPTWMVVTLEGWMVAKVGDWIIKGVKGEFYPCKPDIFAAMYERVGTEE